MSHVSSIHNKSIVEPLLFRQSVTYYLKMSVTIRNACYDVIPIGATQFSGQKEKSFMITPLTCKNVLSPGNQVVIIFN